MNRIMGIPRKWIGTAAVVLIMPLLTIPWTLWIFRITYERDVNEKVRLIAERVRIHLATGQWWSTEQMLEPLKTELLGDPTIQVVGFLDYSRGTRAGFVRRTEKIAVPRTREEMADLIRSADRSCYRSSYDIKTPAGIAGSVYIELSVEEMKKNFDQTEKGLMRSVWMLTAAITFFLGIAGATAFHMWRSSVHHRWLTDMEQHGKQAERGLTAAVMAHEIRNPLQALIFQISTLRRNAGNGERVGDIANTIESELHRIQRLVQDFLQHEKAQAFHVQPVSLAESVRGLQSVMDELLRQKGTKLVVSNQQDARVLCDPHALRQILMNLALNAQQAMGIGGTITIRVSREEEYGLIDISDTGPGIPQEMREKVFKPFTSSKKEGSGIGLALVKRFVDNFGGKISFDTADGAGTTFHIRLPLEQPPAGPAETPAISETPASEKPTVL